MKLWKIFPWVLAASFGLALCWSAYAMLEQSITIAYHEDEMGHLKKQRDFMWLVAQANLVGKSKIETVKFLKANKIEYFEKGEALVAEETNLEFKHGKLVVPRFDGPKISS